MLTLLFAGSLAHAAADGQINPGELTFLKLDVSQDSTFSLQVYDGEQSWYTDCTYYTDDELLLCDDLPKMAVLTIAESETMSLFALDAAEWADSVVGARLDSEDEEAEECSLEDLADIAKTIERNLKLAGRYLKDEWSDLTGESADENSEHCWDRFYADVDACEEEEDALACVALADVDLQICLGV